MELVSDFSAFISLILRCSVRRLMPSFFAAAVTLPFELANACRISFRSVSCRSSGLVRPPNARVAEIRDSKERPGHRRGSIHISSEECCVDQFRRVDESLLHINIVETRHSEKILKRLYRVFSTVGVGVAALYLCKISYILILVEEALEPPADVGEEGLQFPYSCFELLFG